MWILIFRELVTSFKRVWKLYFINIVAIMIIILLFSYINGAKRQLNLQNTIFSGETVLKLKQHVPFIEAKILKSIKNIEYMDKKIRGFVFFKMPGSFNNGRAEIIGIKINNNNKIKKFLNIVEGNYIQNEEEILIPSSLSKQFRLSVGEKINIGGKISKDMYNQASFEICGIYNSPNLSVIGIPKFLIPYEAMETYFLPEMKHIEYCIFFKDSVIPKDINLQILQMLNDPERKIIESIDRKVVSSWDVLNISVQFNIFLYLMSVLTIIVILSIVFFLNININLILFHKNKREIAALLSFGVKRWKINMIHFLKSFLHILISMFIAVFMCFSISFLAKQQITTGFIEVLFVLLSGTNCIDFYIQFSHICIAFFIICAAVIVSQIPVIFEINRHTPREMEYSPI